MDLYTWLIGGAYAFTGLGFYFTWTAYQDLRDEIADMRKTVYNHHEHRLDKIEDRLKDLED